MTLSACDQVAERLALGEPLAELAEHASQCVECTGLIATTSRLGATHHAVDPGLGFSARMTVGAQHRIGVRRRRRIAAGLAASVAGSMFGVFLVTRTPDAPVVSPTMGNNLKVPSPSEDEAPTPAGDDDLAALVQMADTDHASRLSADWGHIEKPLAPYRNVLAHPDEVTP